MGEGAGVDDILGREGSPAALTDEIEQRGGAGKPETFGNITGEARTEIPGAGGDKKSIDLTG